MSETLNVLMQTLSAALRVIATAGGKSVPSTDRDASPTQACEEGSKQVVKLATAVLGRIAAVSV